MSPEPEADPTAEEAVRARDHADRSLLPSNDGLGPGAGETPSAEMDGGPGQPEDDPNPTETPSLRGVPRTTERPDFRSSQLQGAPDEDEPEDSGRR